MIYSKKYSYFQKILVERKEKLHDYIGEKNELIKQMQDSGLYAQSDILQVNMHINRVNSLVRLYKKELEDIEVSLKKIKDKIFGVCEDCGEKISIERLKVKPHAKFCINCREFADKQILIKDKIKNLSNAKIYSNSKGKS